MGRFASAVEFYGSREPYSPQFFRALAARLQLTGCERLIDLGCGPAQLALGLAPFVGEVTGIDVEPAMLDAARLNAHTARLDLRLMECRVEDLPASLEGFEVVTIGRALHWMDRNATLGVLERITAPAGHVAICGSTAELPLNPWAAAYYAVRRSWSSESDEQRYQIDYGAWCSGSRLRKEGELRVASCRAVTVNEIIRRALSMSSTAPIVLGDRRPQFEAALFSAIAPYAQREVLVENIVSVATLLQKEP